MGQLLVTNWCRASIGGVAFWLARAALHFTCSSCLVEENRSSTWILMCGFGSVGGPNTSKLYLAETAERKTDFYTHIFLFFRLATSSCWLLVWNCNQNVENQAMVEANLNLNITLIFTHVENVCVSGSLVMSPFLVNWQLQWSTFNDNSWTIVIKNII